MPRHPAIGSEEMLQLWCAYTEFQSHHLEPSTIQRDYGKLSKRLLAMPVLPTEVEVRDWIVRKYAPDTARRMLQQFGACCNWAVQSKILKVNPYAGMDKLIKVHHEGDRRAFTREERDAILHSIATDAYSHAFASIKQSYYLPYLQFLFWSGCRLSEANGLRWINIAKDCTTITFAEALPADTRTLGKTKTRKIRRVQCNERLVALLKSQEKSTEWVFPSPNGCAIDSHNVLNRTWKPVVEALVDTGSVREYLPLKNTRHTFITLALESGLESKDIAAIVGNSPDIIYKNYAAVRRNLVVPNL